jgi:hypothetical protein
MRRPSCNILLTCGPPVLFHACSPAVKPGPVIHTPAWPDAISTTAAGSGSATAGFRMTRLYSVSLADGTRVHVAHASPLK